YYTKSVIKKLLDDGKFTPHYEHSKMADRIPLPATFIHNLSKEFSDKGIMTLNLYSPYPFPNRRERTLDTFGQKAWESLNKNPKSAFSQVEKINGQKVVRVAVADTMVDQQCVDCHNTHLESPRQGWALGDVRGVLEVQVPITAKLANSQILNFTITLIVLGALGITVGILFMLFKRLISNRLARLHTALTDIAQGDGDLSQRLEVNPKDEIGIIAQAFNHFMEKLSLTLQQIDAQVTQLAGTTGAMESITHKSKKNTKEQYQLTENMAQSMVSMKAATDEMTVIAGKTAQNSQRTQEKTRESTQVIQDNLTSVDNLAHVMHQTSEVVRHLRSGSQNIGGVADVIKGIAEQTNLLALNATIEAARARGQGRGFAVVADEVKTLATQTQESTREINKMIKDLQSIAEKAVETMESGNQGIQINQEKAIETRTIIDSVQEAIGEIENQNTLLSSAANSQADLSNGINNDIKDIQRVALSTNDSSQELLGLAAEINRAVGSIHRELKNFKH
ncbi:MAG: methyl-accepting chemotaxis protein, partial [Desulfobacterales bacterium]|nr:methyl-accepting chemotaxis protein [Desulfobacterales bacterium]